MKYRILAFIFFSIGFADLLVKIFFGNIFNEFTEDYYEIANPILVFTPVLFFSIGGIFLKEAKVNGNKTENGKMMFAYQAQKAFELWNNLKPEINEQVLNLLDD